MVEKSHAEKEDQSDRAAGRRQDYHEKRAGHGGEEWPSRGKVEGKYRSPHECTFYQRGLCDRHDACQFDHKLPGFADVGDVVHPSILNLRLCKWQRESTTGCKHGSECSFVHVPQGICKLFMLGPDACNNRRYPGGCSGGTHTQITMKEMCEKMQMQSRNDDTLQMMEGVVKKNEEKKRPRKDRSRSRRSPTPIQRKKKKNYNDGSVTLTTNPEVEERRKPNRLSFT